MGHLSQNKHQPLTAKQQGFVNDYINTGGDALEAVRRNYDAPASASTLAYENMHRANVVAEIEKRLEEYFPNAMLAQRHIMLLNKNDPETGEPDTQATSKALDMAYKLKGSYAAEKTTVMNVNVDVKPTDENMEAIRLEFENRIKEQLASPE